MESQHGYQTIAMSRFFYTSSLFLHILMGGFHHDDVLHRFWAIGNRYWVYNIFYRYIYIDILIDTYIFTTWKHRRFWTMSSYGFFWFLWNISSPLIPATHCNYCIAKINNGDHRKTTEQCSSEKVKLSWEVGTHNEINQ